MTLAFPSGSNLGAMIAPQCADAQPWLIEVTPGGGQRVLTYGDLRDGAGAIAQGATVEEFAKFLRDEQVLWGKVVREANIQPGN